jgi:hypothetical protein
MNTWNFVIEKPDVLFHGGNESLNSICMKVVLPKRVMAEPVSYCLVTAKAKVRSRVCVRSVVEKWHSDRFFSEYFGFPLSVPFHRCSILILIVTDLQLSSEGQMGEDGEPARIFGGIRQESTFTLSFSCVRKISKATISFVTCVCPSTWDNSAPIGRIFMKFGIWVFFENLLRELKFH